MDPGGGYEFEQAVRRLVNFGVVSLARALGGTPNQVLELRCECTRRLCTSRVRVRLGDYGDGSSTLLLDRCHRAGSDRAIQTGAAVVDALEWRGG
jgi:hypothetical protein